MVLLETAVATLTLSDTNHAVKLDCIQWIASRLVTFVPVFELEDLVLKPLLHSVLDYLDEVMHMMEDGTEDGVIFLSLVNSLLEHTESIVVHCKAQKECGLGEIPSLPRLIPKILVKTFQFLHNSGDSGNSETKSVVNQCFVTSRSLLTIFLALLEEVKVRTVLEDELDLLVTVCQDLVSFHDVLIPLDFKLTCMVWKLYLKLTTKYQSKLTDKLDFSKAMNKVSEELVKQYRNLRCQLETLTEDCNINKDVTKVAYLLKIVQTFIAQTSSAGDCQSFLDVLKEVFQGLPTPPTWVPDVAKKKMSEELSSPQVKSMFIKFASRQHFLTFFVSKSFKSEKSKDVFLDIAMELLLNGTPNYQEDLMRFCLMSLSQGGGCLDGALRVGRQEIGKKPVLVDRHSWILTNLCSVIATLDPDQFGKVESQLFSHLLSPSSSPQSLILVSDIFCFIARYSTSKLCLSYLNLLWEIQRKLQGKVRSLNLIFVERLISRLEPLLSASHRSQWKQMTSSLANHLSPEQTWAQLASGQYDPQVSMSSLDNLERLVQDTINSFDSISNKEVLVDSVFQVVQSGKLSEAHLTLIIPLMETSLIKIPLLSSREDFKDFVKLVQSNQASLKSASLMSFAIILSQKKMKEKMSGLQIEILSSQNQSCTCCDWTQLKSSCWNEKFSTSGGMTRVMEHPGIARASSSRNKKRKLSEDKENVLSSVKKLEREVEFLCDQDHDNLGEVKENILVISNRLKSLSKKIK